MPRTTGSSSGRRRNGRSQRVSGGSGVFPDVDGLSREVTPAADFYHVSKNVFDPDAPPPGWRLEVGGAVARPRAYTLDELRALPAAEAYATLACISNFVGGDLISNALWRGVPLADLLADAGAGEGAVDVVLTAFDDYTDSITIERAMQPGSLLAYDDRSALDRIMAPVLLLWGDADDVVDREMQDQLVAALAQAALVVYPGLGHTPRWEDPQRFAADVAAFTSTVWRR